MKAMHTTNVPVQVWLASQLTGDLSRGANLAFAHLRMRLAEKETVRAGNLALSHVHWE